MEANSKGKNLLIPNKIDAQVLTKGIEIFEERPSPLSTCIKSVEPLTNSQEITFPFILQNLTASDIGCRLLEKNLLGPNWSSKVFLEGTEITSYPYETEIPKYSYKSGEIKITIPANEPKARIGFQTLFLKNSDGNAYDSIKAVLSSWIADFEDVKKEAEMVAVSEALFPSSASVSAETANKFILQTENEILYSQILGKASSTALSYENTARQLITNRVLERLLLRLTAYTLGGEAVYIKIIRQLRVKIADLSSVLESAY